MSKSYDDLEFAQKVMIDSYGVDSTVPLSVMKGEITTVRVDPDDPSNTTTKKVWQYNEKKSASLADVMTQYWKKVETDLRLNKDYATIHKSDPHMLQQPYLFDKKPPGAPATYPFLTKKKNYTDTDIRDMDYMHNLIKMLHNKDKTIGTSLMDEIKNNTLILQEDPNTMINRKKHYDELAEYELRRLFIRGKKRKILHAVPVLQPSIYIDTSKKTFDTAYYNVAMLITMTANFTVNKGNDFHPGTRLQRYHNSLYARAQGMLNKISSKQEAINQYRIRHIQREWEHYANMFNYDFMHLPPGYDPLPPTNCWISKTNMKFLNIDRSYHNELLTRAWVIDDYLYFDPTLLEDAAGYEAWKVWAEKEKKQYAKLCMEEFEKPSDWTLGPGALTLEPGPPFKLNELRAFKKAGKRAKGWSASSSTPPPPPPPAINPPPPPPPNPPPAITPAAIQAAVDQHILDIRATVDQPALDIVLNANKTTINNVARTQLNATQKQAIGDAIRIQERKFLMTVSPVTTPTVSPTVSPANSAPPSPQQQPPAQQPFSFAKTKYFGEMNVKYKIRRAQKGKVLELVNVFANQSKGSQASSMVKSIINYYKGQNKPIDYIILSPYLLNDEGLLNYYQQKWGMDIAVVGKDVNMTSLGSLVANNDNAKVKDWIDKINKGAPNPNVWDSTWMIVSVDDLLAQPLFKDACGFGGKGGLKVLKKKTDSINITVDEFKEVVEKTFLSDSDGNAIDLTNITDATIKTELKKMIRPNINEPELLFFHRGAVDRATCVTATKCELEYSDRKELILKNIADGTYDFDLKLASLTRLFAPSMPYDFNVIGMTALLLSCKGNACPPNKTKCGAEHPEVVERFAKEILSEYLTDKGKMRKKSGEEMIKTLIKKNLEKKLKDKAAGILKKVTSNTWTLVYLGNVLNLQENAQTFIPVTKEKIELFLTGKVFDNFKVIKNHFAVDSTFNAIVEPVATDLVDQLTAKAPAAPVTVAPVPLEPDEDTAGLQELNVKELIVDPTWGDDKPCCRFTFKHNNATYYVRTYKPSIETDHHSFVSELENCYQKNQKDNVNREIPKSRSSAFKYLMPLHLFTEFNTIGDLVTVKKKSDIGGSIHGGKSFRGLKLKFPSPTVAPIKGKHAFYIQKQRGIPVKKWLENNYYASLDGNTITKMKETNFGGSLDKLKAPMTDIKRIRDGVRNALKQLHSINDCGNNNETFRFLHRDIKIDNVAVTVKDGKVDRVRLFDYNAVVDTNKSNWTTLAKNRKQLPMRNGTYDLTAKTVTSTGDGSLMDRYIATKQFNKIPKENLKYLDYHQAGMMMLQLGGIFDWVPDYKWDAPEDFANFGTRVEDPGKRMMFDKHKIFLKNSSDERLEGYDTETVANFWENILRNGKQRTENGAFTYGNRKNDDLKAQTVRADWFITQGRKLNETKYNQTVPIAQDVWNLSSEFVVKVFNEFFKTQNEIDNSSSGNVGGSGAGITSPIQFLSQARQPVFERIQIQSDYGDDEDLEALMEFDPDLENVDLEKMSPSSHISDAEFERMLNETTNYDALSEHIARENKAYSDHSTDMEVEEDAKSVSSKHSSNSVASISSQMSNMSSHSVASNMSSHSVASVASNMSSHSVASVASNMSAQSDISVASNLSERSNASTMSNMSNHSYKSTHSVESEEAYPTSEHSEQSFGGYSELSYNNNTSGFSNSSSHSSSESSGKEMGYSNGLSESSDHGMSESSDHESSNESMGYSSSGGSSSNNHSYNSSSETE